VSAPTRGSNLLRHSVATAMLREGISLPAIGIVLRHRSPQTTAHYAKVDVEMLRAVAQPWLGGAPC
jgi:integrase/recombinase XerD